MTPKLKKAIEFLLVITGHIDAHYASCSTSVIGSFVCNCGLDEARKIVKSELRGGKK